MQRIQNLCAKIGENMTVLLYNSPYRSEVHWVPIKCRISFKILTFMYNCSEGHASTGVFKRTFVETVHRYVLPEILTLGIWVLNLATVQSF